MKGILKVFAIAGVVLIGIQGKASAQQASCDDIASLANTIMEQRQSGAPKSAILRRIERSNVNAKESVKLMVERAYNERLQSRAVDKHSAAVRFSNEMYRSCLNVQSILR